MVLILNSSSSEIAHNFMINKVLKQSELTHSRQVKHRTDNLPLYVIFKVHVCHSLNNDSLTLKKIFGFIFNKNKAINIIHFIN